MDLDKAIKSRNSIRKFKEKKPDWRDVIECIEYSRYAPMAGANFTPRFIITEDAEKIEKLAQAAQQPFITQSKIVVVVCSNILSTINAYGERGETYSRQQAGASIQNFLLKLQEKNLSTCWVGHFVESIVKETLKIPENVNVEAIFPIGYAFEKPKTKKIQIDLDQILYFEKYKNKRRSTPRDIGRENYRGIFHIDKI